MPKGFRLRSAFLAGLAVMTAAAVLALAGSPAAAQGSRPALDVEIAIDTTGSMGPSIEAARDNARALVRELRRIAPNLRVAIVQFRDRGDTPEYQVVQPMTASAASVDAALDSLSAGGGGDLPEAYNLVFQQSYADPANTIGWRPGSRKVVVVIGDAEPHGAGAAGLTGCTDTSADPNGLNTATELARMSAARRTLVMVRQSSSARASLECYESIAQSTFGQGTAVDGDDDLVAAVRLLVGDAVARFLNVQVTARANNVRGLPFFQLGVFNFQGNRRLRLADGNLTPVSGQPLRFVDRDFFTSPLLGRRPRRHRVVVQVIGGTYEEFPAGVRIPVARLRGRAIRRGFTVAGPVRVATLLVVVVRSNLSVCRRGTRGRILLIDSQAPLSNGQPSDFVEEIYPLAGGPQVAAGGPSCRTHVHGVSNANNNNTRPVRGGFPGGGQRTKVTLAPRL